MGNLKISAPHYSSKITAVALIGLFVAFPANPANGQHKRTIVEDGIGLSVYDYSDRDDENRIPIIYFHGTSSSKREPDLLVGQLKKKKRILVSFDRPGYGDSCSHYFGCLDDYDRWAKEKLLPAIEKALGYKPKRYDLVSMSGGAVFAMRTVHVLPKETRKISLLSAGLFARPVGGEGQYERARRLAVNRPRVARWIVKVANRNPELSRALSVKKFSAPDKAFAECHRELHVKLFVDATKCGEAGIVQDARLQLCDMSYAKPLPEGVKGEIWKGACDLTVSHESSKLLAKKTGIELTVIENEGHLSSLPLAFEKSVLSHEVESSRAKVSNKTENSAKNR